jgi:AcrR family transcriptional regulator
LQPHNSGDTRERLLHTALGLYAREGLHAVSLRRIAVEAGSKNSAAVHYHFDNKLGVIRALVKMIARELQRLDSELRDAGRQTGQTARDRSALQRGFRQTLLPLMQLRDSQPWGADAVHFLSRLVSDGDEEVAAMINEVYAPFWRHLDGALAHEFPELPPSVRHLRLLFMTTNVIHGMAEADWLRHPPLGEPAVSALDREQLLDHLVDYLIGGLQAPCHADNQT